MHKHIILSLLLALFSICFETHAQAFQLSSHAKISLLTCSPCDDEVYALYGHTAIRIQDTLQTDPSRHAVDYVFNYGIFDFSKPHFIYRFAKGETDYMLGVHDFNHFLSEYQMRGSEVYEQILNLDSVEKARLWNALITNALPENRIYRYNFFFDNCATRPAAMIEHCTNGKIAYAELPQQRTFRDMINYCTRNHPWVTFGCDLVLGTPTDRPVTRHESLFIPEYLKEAYANAWIINSDGSKRKLISENHVLSESTTTDPEKSFVTPLFCSLLLFLITLLLTFIEVRKKTYFRWLDCLLFLVAGIAGCILFFLCFFSVHPSIWPNLSIIWLHPLHLVGVILFAVKKLNKAAYCYHFINFAALLIVLIGWLLSHQHLNLAFIPLILTLLTRSGIYITRKKKENFE